MKILMTLANPFTNDPRVYNEAKSLINAGHEVTILAWDKKKEYPYEEVIDGITVVRSNNTKIMDLIPLDIFRMHLWWRKGYKDVIKLFNQWKFDVIHCHDLDSLPIGIKLKKKFGLPLIYDAHEIWGYMVAGDIPTSWANYYLWKEKYIIKYVDKIITVNQPLKKYFRNISKKSITIIMNCKLLQSRKYESPKNEKFTLIYLGIIGKSRFLLELADVGTELPDIHLIIGGIESKKDYANRLKEKCSKIKNVEFIGKLPINEVLSTTKKADVVICMTDPDDLNNSRALANKQFEAMVCGRPIICTKGTYPGNFTEKEKCGLVAAYTKKDLKETIIRLRDNLKLREELGKNALKAAIAEYNWKKQEEKMLKIYEEL